MRIRAATPADLDALVALRLDLLREIDHVQGDPSDLAQALSAWFADHLADGSFLCWVGDDGGRVVACRGLWSSTAHRITEISPAATAT